MSNIKNIPGNYNFLETLSSYLLQEFKNKIHNVTVFLPTKRSGIELRNLLITKTSALILPKIKVITDLDYEYLAGAFDRNLFDKIPLPSFSFTKYHFLLIEEIKEWNKKSKLFGENISVSQISSIALSLSEFLDEVEERNLSLENLDQIDEVDFAIHQQKIFNFLKNFSKNLSDRLRKNNIISKTYHQNYLLDLFIKYLNNHDSPIVIAGINGQERLLKAIYAFKYGYIICNSIDKYLNDDIWNNISNSHPQFQNKQLLESLNISRFDVQDIKFKDAKIVPNRSKLVSYSMLPYKYTDNWKNLDLEKTQVDGVSIIEARNNFEEARVISLAIEENLYSAKNIMLITNDIDLQLLVKNYLNCRKIEIEYSENRYIYDSQLNKYLLSLIELVESNFNYTVFLSILKHPFTRAGFNEDIYKKHIVQFEMDIIRSIYGENNIQKIIKLIRKKNNVTIFNWFIKIINIISPLKKIYNYKIFHLGKILEISLEVIENLSRNENNEIIFYKHEDSEEFIKYVNEVIKDGENFVLDRNSYKVLLRNLSYNYKLSYERKESFKVKILSTIDAQLINSDVVIVSNLNENEFLSRIKTESWLSGKIRKEFGLKTMNDQIGISSKDFSDYFNNKKVILTRSHIKDNTLCLKSRFLLRLESVLKANSLSLYIDKGEKYLKYLQKQATISQKELTKSSITIENKFFPSQISVTDINKYIKDPYYLYAKRILKFNSLNKIENEPSFLEFGNFIHSSLEHIVKKSLFKVDSKSYHKSLKLLFKKYFPDKKHYLIWWYKALNIIDLVKDNIKDDILYKNKRILSEVKADLMIGNITVKTKIDRIDIEDNKITIIDYKTGAIPSQQSIKKLFDIQLALEALVLSSGNIQDNLNVKNKDIFLQYIHCKGKDGNKIIDIKNTSELILNLEREIDILFTIFKNQKITFDSWPDISLFKKNEYRHLSRIDELYQNLP